MDKRPRKQSGQRPAPSVPAKRKPYPSNFSNPHRQVRPVVKNPPKEDIIPQKPGLVQWAKGSLHNLGLHIFYSRERIFCGVVCTLLMIFFALLQTTVFSAVRPFGAVPDLMISFVLALAVTEGEKWGAIFGIAAAVIIESLGLTEVTLLPLLYMPIGFFCGVLCRYYFTGSAAVRCVMTLSVLPLRAVFTAVYIILSPMVITFGEATLQIVLPELLATLAISVPVHLIMYICLRPFHRTRAEMVSEK